jgi:hypothetical protein
MICHLFELRFHNISPIYSSGVFTSTSITGSRSTGLAFFAASLKHFEAANLNESSFESTS